MKNIHMIGTWQQLKAISEPLRLRMLDEFSRMPMTTKQVASILGEGPTRLYHHAELLERAGLIRQVRTRQNRGTIEKYYQAVAREFQVDRKLLEVTRGAAPATSGYEKLFLSALEATLSEARKSIDAGLIKPVEEGRNALLYRHKFSCSKAEFEGLMKTIQGWIEQCEIARGGRGEMKYNLSIAFYPVSKSKQARKKTRGKRGND